MPVSQRAKQFMPFSAVKGLDEALARQERNANRKERNTLGEEQIETINKALCRLKKGTEVFATYFSDGEYQTINGIVERVDEIRQVFRVRGNMIPFEDIQEIEVITNNLVKNS